jgi:hypothetical protein
MEKAPEIFVVEHGAMATGGVVAAHAGKVHRGEGKALAHTISLSGLICGQWGGNGLFFADRMGTWVVT